jgi:hypothetical protein
VLLLPGRGPHDLEVLAWHGRRPLEHLAARQLHGGHVAAELALLLTARDEKQNPVARLGPAPTLREELSGALDAKGGAGGPVSRGPGPGLVVALDDVVDVLEARDGVTVRVALLEPLSTLEAAGAEVAELRHAHLGLGLAQVARLAVEAEVALAVGDLGHLGLGVVVDGVGRDEMELPRRDGVAALALGGPGGLHVDGLAVVVDEVLEGGLGVLELLQATQVKTRVNRQRHGQGQFRGRESERADKLLT